MTTKPVHVPAAPVALKRLEIGYAQPQVAEALGLSREAVSMLENGKTWPRPPQVVRLAALYDMPLGDLCRDLIRGWFQANPQNAETEELLRELLAREAA
jgi:transcriptional regulator with XRE-family HTH domain